MGDDDDDDALAATSSVSCCDVVEFPGQQLDAGGAQAVELRGGQEGVKKRRTSGAPAPAAQVCAARSLRRSQHRARRAR